MSRRPGSCTGKSADVLDRKIEALRELPPPADAGEQAEKVLEGMEENANLVRTLARAGLRGDVDAVGTLFDELERQSQRLGGLAEGFGFEYCPR